MKERPILFSAPMVRAILDGKKTQTRRVVKPQPEACSYVPGTHALNGQIIEGNPAVLEQCPYGQPGDRLWVREAFFDHGHFPEDPNTPIGERVEYRASEWDRVDPADGGPWKPSIHMPRWASRITLELTDVRVQMLQEISWEDAIAEGIRDPRRAATRIDPECGCVLKFADLWDSINAKRGFGWVVNPWVWALTFKREEVAT